MKAIVSFVVLIFFIALVVGFSTMNAGQEVTVKFLGLRMEHEFSFFMFAALVIGLCIGALLMSFSLMKNKVKVRQLSKKLAKAEKELGSLKNLPSKL